MLLEKKVAVIILLLIFKKKRIFCDFIRTIDNDSK